MSATLDFGAFSTTTCNKHDKEKYDKCESVVVKHDLTEQVHTLRNDMVTSLSGLLLVLAG
jgi:hypothetical protein